MESITCPLLSSRYLFTDRCDFYVSNSTFGIFATRRPEQRCCACRVLQLHPSSPQLLLFRQPAIDPRAGLSHLGGRLLAVVKLLARPHRAACRAGRASSPRCSWPLAALPAAVWLQGKQILKDHCELIYSVDRVPTRFGHTVCKQDLFEYIFLQNFHK